MAIPIGRCHFLRTIILTVHCLERTLALLPPRERKAGLVLRIGCTPPVRQHQDAPPDS